MKCANLLHEHDEKGTLCSTTITWHHKELLKQILTLPHLILDGNLLMNVIQISGSLQSRPSESLECREGFFVSVLTHVPSGTFGHQVDLGADEDGRDRCGGEDDAPFGICVA